jgi:hypothetical protein
MNIRDTYKAGQSYPILHALPQRFRQGHFTIKKSSHNCEISCYIFLLSRELAEQSKKKRIIVISKPKKSAASTNRTRLRLGMGLLLM